MARLLLFPAKKQHYCYWRNAGDTLMHWHSQGDTFPRLLKFSKMISVKQSLTDIEEKRKRKIRLLLESDSDIEKRKG